MKIPGLGATGATGGLIVNPRSKAKAADLAGAELVEGDARDAIALTCAIAGCDAVVSSLGTPMSPFREVTMLSTATLAMNLDLFLDEFKVSRVKLGALLEHRCCNHHRPECQDAQQE